MNTNIITNKIPQTKQTQNIDGILDEESRIMKLKNKYTKNIRAQIKIIATIKISAKL